MSTTCPNVSRSYLTTRHSTELRRELWDIEAYCKMHSVSIVVDIEQLCLDNLGEGQPPYQVPDEQTHRLVQSSPSGSSQHYRWLCFSTSACDNPPDWFGLCGDVWVVTGSPSQNVYYRSGTGWQPAGNNPALSQHPFAPDLYLAFGIHKIGWFPKDLIENVFPAVWTARVSPHAHKDVLWPATVDALYDATGRPKDHGDSLSSAVVLHRCLGQSRGCKQWLAPRIRLLINIEEVSDSGHALKELSGVRAEVGLCPQKVWNHQDAASLEWLASSTQVSGNPGRDGVMITAQLLPDRFILLWLGDRLVKIDLSRINKYAKNFALIPGNPRIVVDSTGEPLHVYDLDRGLRVDLDALENFILLIEHDL